MQSWSVTFLQPWWLVALALLPAVAWLSRKSLAGLGPARRVMSIALRCTVLALLIAALADFQWVFKSDQLCTLFVLDQSQSIPDRLATESLEHVSRAMANRPRDGDLSGLIVFGREARIELPPAEYPRDRALRSVGSLIDRQYTNLAAGIELAMGSLPPNATGRLVIVSDGNQNRGNALAQAVAAAKAGFAVDVVPMEYRYDAEVLVDKVLTPSDLKKGDTASLKIVIRSGEATSGLLRLSRVADGRRETLAEQQIELQPGLNVQYVRQTIDEPNFYTYEAQFEPSASSGDTLARNNSATSFTWVRGEGRVLLLEKNAGEHQTLVDALRADSIQVFPRTVDQLSDDLAELRQFDAVIVANVPAEDLNARSQEMIATNTRVLGAGLLMIGGPDSFGAGGYKGSPLEAALPVDMDVKSTKITGKGALVLIMHASEIPEGNFWQKKTAELAVKQLSASDECGLLYWNGAGAWLFNLQLVGDGSRMLRRIDTMNPGDMPDFDSTMKLAVEALQKSDALTKHCIIISDGDPAPPAPNILSMFKSSKISCTTVSIAAHGSFEKQVMKRIAGTTGGRYYEVVNAKTLPAIYTKETRTVSRPLIYEKTPAWSPLIDYGGEPIAGLDRSTALPGITGFVLTTPKPTAVVEIRSPQPAELEHNPILAHWQYGLGRSVAFTTDVGQRWATSWPTSDIYRKFWSQLVRWSMRSAESDHLTISTQEKDGTVKVVVNAVDDSNEFLNMLPLQGSVVRPNVSVEPLKFVQTEPGRYEAEFKSDQSGSYMIRASSPRGDGKGQDLAFSAVNVSYPPEFRDTRDNRDFLENLALASGGRLVEWKDFDTTDFFAPAVQPTRRLQDAWPQLLLAGLVLLFFDVAVRRIAIEPARVKRLASRVVASVLRKPAPAPSEATLDRLKSIKAQVNEEIRSRRFETEAESAIRPEDISLDVTRTNEEPRPIEKPTPTAPTLTPEPPGETPDSPTARLLRAKKKVWEDRDNKDKPSPS